MYRGETEGTETSKYFQEKKKKLIPKVVASEIGKVQTRSRNTSGVAEHNKVIINHSRIVQERQTEESESLVSEMINKMSVSRVQQDTRNLVGSWPDHRPRLNTNW